MNKLFLGVSLLIGSVMASPEMEPKKDPAYGWDWSSTNWFNAVANNNPGEISSPWLSGERFGDENLMMAVGNSNKSEGWVLYTRRIFSSDTRDYGSFSKDIEPTVTKTYPIELKPQDAGSVKNDPYFVLYNKFTGVLRFFLFNSKNYTGTQTISKIKIKEKDLGEFNNHGLFLNSYPDGQSLSDVGSLGSYSDYNVVNRYQSNNWLIIDLVVDYDPNLASRINQKPYMLDVELFSKEINIVDLGGSLVSKEIIKEEDKFAEAIGSLAGMAGSTIGGWAGSNFVGLMRGIASRHSGKFEGQLGKLVDEFSEDSTLNKAGGELAGGNLKPFAASFVVKKFFGNSEQNRVSFDTSLIQLEGTVSTEHSLDHREVPLLHSKYDLDEEIPFVAKSKDITRLGLFSLKERPRMHIYVASNLSTNWHYTGKNNKEYDKVSLKEKLSISVDPITKNGKFQLNPESGAKLHDVTFTPILKLPHTRGRFVEPYRGLNRSYKSFNYSKFYGDNIFYDYISGEDGELGTKRIELQAEDFKENGLNNLTVIEYSSFAKCFGSSYSSCAVSAAVKPKNQLLKFRNEIKAFVKAMFVFSYNIGGEIKLEYRTLIYPADITFEYLDEADSDDAFNWNFDVPYVFENSGLVADEIQSGLDNVELGFLSWNSHDDGIVSKHKYENDMGGYDNDLILVNNGYIQTTISGPGYLKYSCKGYGDHGLTLRSNYTEGPNIKCGNSTLEEHEVYIDSRFSSMDVWWVGNGELDHVYFEKEVNIVPTILTPLLLN